MKERNIQFTFKNISFYILGFFIIGFGVNFTLRSMIGAGAWDTTNYALNAFLEKFFTNVTLGTTSLIISFTIFSVVMIYKVLRFRDKKISELDLLIQLFMLVPMAFVSIFIDLWDIYILQDLMPSSFLIQLLWFIAGGLAIPLGLSLIVASNFPAFVFDEWTLMMSEVLKIKNFGFVRLGIEITGVVIALIFGLLAGIGLGQINIGSLVMMVAIGPIMNVFLKLLGYKKVESPNE